MHAGKTPPHIKEINTSQKKSRWEALQAQCLTQSRARPFNAHQVACAHTHSLPWSSLTCLLTQMSLLEMSFPVFSLKTGGLVEKTRRKRKLKKNKKQKWPTSLSRFSSKVMFSVKLYLTPSPHVVFSQYFIRTIKSKPGQTLTCTFFFFSFMLITCQFSFSI